jgi:hypothetical protein
MEGTSKMPAVWELIDEREAAATAAAETLREQIAKLSAELDLVDTELTDSYTAASFLSVKVDQIDRLAEMAPRWLPSRSPRDRLAVLLRHERDDQRSL